MSFVPLTISLPVYKAELFLTECLRSIQDQTFGDFEVYCVLDGCTDRSEQILMDLCDTRFVVMKWLSNNGVVAALNHIIKHASAPLIARMDADDVMVPDRLAIQMEFMRQNPDVDILGSWFDYIDEKGRTTQKAVPFPTMHPEIANCFRRHNCVGGATVLCRTHRLRQVGSYDPDTPIAEDLTLWLKCLANGIRFANYPEVLYHYRQHAAQSSGRLRKYMLEMTDSAYARYGQAIWGANAPEIHLSDPLWKRALRKIGKTLKP